MEEVIVGTKYQVVIPKAVRRKIKGLRPGSRVTVGKLDENTIAVKTEPANWIERTKGMMTEAWKGIDTTAELEKMRDEWEEKPKILEKSVK